MLGLPMPGGAMLWKIATGGAAVVALVLAFFLLTSTLENRSLTKERDKLSRSITDPNTGYIARLTQSRTNVVTLEGAIKTQNEAYQRESAAAQAKLVSLNKELSAAQAETRASERRLSQFLATKPKGNTLAERVTDIDNRVLKDLNK